LTPTEQQAGAVRATAEVDKTRPEDERGGLFDFLFSHKADITIALIELVNVCF